MMKVFSLLIVIASCCLPQARAFEAAHGIRSARGLLMGDAFTALADDEFTLFYNPAALGRHKRDFTMSPFNPIITGNNVLSDTDRFEDFPDSPTGVADRVMNYPLHVGAGIAPGFKLFNFGFNFIANEQVDLIMRNKVHPIMDVDYRSDRGFKIGAAIPLGPSRLGPRGNTDGQQTSLGVGAKYIRRKGLFESYAVTGTDFLNYISDGGDAEDIVKKLGFVEGSGWGFDAALEHVIRKGPSQFTLALSALDITDTEYKLDKKDPQGRVLATDENQVNLGMAWAMRTPLLRMSFSADVRNLTQEMDFGQRLRFGTELGVPGISVLGGIGAGYYSYGARIDMGFLTLTAGFYGEEMGAKYRQIRNDRFILYLSLFDFSFDA